MTKPLADVYHLDIYGLRKDKYQMLLDNGINTLPWNKIECRAPEYFFVAKDFGVLGQYEQGFSVCDLFPVNSSGIQTKRDALFIDFDKAKLAKRLELLLSNQFDSKFATDFNIQDSSSYFLKRKIADSNYSEKYLRSVLYRPFDTRHIYYDKDLLGRAFYNVMQHFVNGENVGLITCRQQSTFDFQHIFISDVVSDLNSISLQTKETSVVFPLYLYPETTGQQSLQETSVRQPNLNPAIVQQIAEKLSLTFTPEKSTVIPAGNAGIQNPGMEGHNIPVTGYPHPGGYDVSFDTVQIGEIKESGNQNIVPTSFAPIDLLDYIYAVLHSPNYRDTYKEFLKTDFPRVPYPDPHTFWPLVKLGGELRQLHLLDGAVTNNPITTYPMGGDNTVTRKINQHDYTDGKVWINDTQYFDGVPKIAWEFYIGGYQPAQKWLKDRHGRTLTFEDILHYQKIIVALSETHRIMQAIDAV
jgi:predicted helicase